MKGKTLGTAIEQKTELPSSPVETAENGVSQTLDLVLTNLDDSKAEDIVSIDIRGKSPLADHLVIATGRSHRHVAALADHLVRMLKETGRGNARVEGLSSADWVLVDTGDIIVHIFRPEVREFYNLEKMWRAPELEGATKQ